MTEVVQLSLLDRMATTVTGNPAKVRGNLRGDMLAVADELGFADVMGAAFSAFDLMEVAERLITEAQERHGPKCRAMLWDMFPALRPTWATGSYTAPELYPAHVTELLDRAVANWDGKTHGNSRIDLSLGTSAEMCFHMSEASLVVRPRESWAYVFQQAFTRVFGADHPAIAGAYQPFESWKGEALVLEGQLRTFIGKQFQWRRFRWADDRWRLV